MPFERMGCCGSNRVTNWDNCCGLCGPITGNPKQYDMFYPQPSDPQAFIDVAKPAQIASMERGGAM